VLECWDGRPDVPVLVLALALWALLLGRVKARAGIHGNEIEDRLVKEATQNYYVAYSRIPKCAINGYPERKHKKMAKPMEPWGFHKMRGIT